jgi:hypothetical protein
VACSFEGSELVLCGEVVAGGEQQGSSATRERRSRAPRVSVLSAASIVVCGKLLAVHDG